MKKIICAMLLAALVITLSGCTKIEGTLHEVGEKFKSEQLDTPQSGSASGRLELCSGRAGRWRSRHSPMRFRMRL